MDVREKLVELLAPTSLNFEEAVYLADYLVKNGVTVQDESNEIKQLKNQVVALKKSNRNWRRKVQRMRNRHQPPKGE